MSSVPENAIRRSSLAGWQQWWLRRRPVSDTLALTQRNVTILPTGAGSMLAVTLLALLVASINYQLNLGYLLTFLLAGSALVALYMTHANLCGLQLQLHSGEPVFAGQAAAVTVILHNSSRRARYAIGLNWLAPDGEHSSSVADVSWTDVPPFEQSTLQLRWTLPKRGRHGLPALHVQTRFPIGAFRSWCWWRPAAAMLAYPAPEMPSPPLPLLTGGQDGSNAASLPGASDEYEGVRPWRRGDPLKWVAWKKVARQAACGRDNWISRDFVLPQGRQIWLDPDKTNLIDPERRLSRLCAWVLIAETQGLDYGLRLPGLEIAPDHGAAHRQRCLEALALC